MLTTMSTPTIKTSWHGTIASIQPRIRLYRSFDERSHSYLGYSLEVDGLIGNEARSFTIGIGKGAQDRHRLQHGDVVSGASHPVAVARTEAVELYKTSAFKVEHRGAAADATSPPWHGVPPNLTVYRQRGHRRLSARTFRAKCRSCIWGCRMPTEMTIDHWNPTVKRWRFETACYGPKSCPLYRPGPNRRVPGRNGMVWIEEDWVDEEATRHRGPDE